MQSKTVNASKTEMSSSVRRCGLETSLRQCILHDCKTDWHIICRGHSSYGLQWSRDHPLTCTKRIFRQKISDLSPQTNLTRWIKRSFAQNTAGKVLWRGLWTLHEWKLRRMVSKMSWGVALRRITPSLMPISRMAPVIKLLIYILFSGWMCCSIASDVFSNEPAWSLAYCRL